MNSCGKTKKLSNEESNLFTISMALNKLTSSDARQVPNWIKLRVHVMMFSVFESKEIRETSRCEVNCNLLND